MAGSGFVAPSVDLFNFYATFAQEMEAQTKAVIELTRELSKFDQEITASLQPQMQTAASAGSQPKEAIVDTAAASGTPAGRGKKRRREDSTASCLPVAKKPKGRSRKKTDTVGAMNSFNSFRKAINLTNSLAGLSQNCFELGPSLWKAVRENREHKKLFQELHSDAVTKQIAEELMQKIGIKTYLKKILNDPRPQQSQAGSGSGSKPVEESMPVSVESAGAGSGSGKSAELGFVLGKVPELPTSFALAFPGAVSSFGVGAGAAGTGSSNGARYRLFSHERSRAPGSRLPVQAQTTTENGDKHENESPAGSRFS